MESGSGERSEGTNGCDERDEDNTDAVSVSKAGGVAINGCDDDSTNHEEPVGKRNVDLAVE